MENSDTQVSKEITITDKIKSNRKFSGIFDKLKSNLSLEYENQDNEFLRVLKEAHADWKNAEIYFQNVTEPDLIDFAIYQMEAAKTKYIFLLKQAREMGLKSENLENSL